MQNTQVASEPDLRPDPVLTIGVTGHRKLPVNSDSARHVEESISHVLGLLRTALGLAVGASTGFYSARPPKLRIISMVAEGADMLASRIAQGMDAEIACVLPFPTNEFLQDFSTPDLADLALQTIDHAATRLVLPGSRVEGDRAYERANQIILAHSDILLAVWDGERALGRAGTGDVVQTAVQSDIPTIVVDPRPSTDVTFIRAPTEIEFDGPSSYELPRRPLDTNAVTELVRKVIEPPSGKTQRQSLEELFGQVRPNPTWRIEYPILLKVFAPKPHERESSVRSIAIDIDAKRTDDGQWSRLLSSKLARLDELAAHYGQKYRSSVVTGSILLIVAAAIPGIVGLLFPTVAGKAIVLQVVANGLILLDGYIREKHRWQGRWLDYRTAAERLRSFQFLQPLGLTPAASGRLPGRQGPSVVGWYVTRSSRELGPPSRAITSAELLASKDGLINFHIKQQVEYHRRTARQLGGLDRRLLVGTRIALVGAMAVGLAVAASVYFAGAIAVGWKGIANLMLIVLPAAATSFNGLRAEADLVRLVERSIGAAVVLLRLRRALRTLQPTYDSVAIAAGRVAATMGVELYEWRFVLESREARLQRRKIKAG